MNGALSWPFLRLYILVFFYFSANAILNVIIPLKGEAWGASNTQIGLIMGSYLFTTMFFRPWAGQKIQKYGPVKVLRAILIINGLALILYTFTGPIGYLAARILQGMSTAFFSMALQIGIIDALPEEDRSQGISLYSLFSYIPGIIGPLAAIGIWQGEMESFAYVMIGIVAVTGLVGYSVKWDGKGEPLNKGSGIDTFRSYAELIRNPHLFKSGMIMLISSIVFGAVTTFIPLYAMELRGTSAGIYLMIQAATVVMSRFVLRKRIPSDGRWHGSFMMMTMLILMVASLSVASSPITGVVPFYMGAVLMGVAQALVYPTLTTYLSFVLPRDQRNVLLGLFIATADLGVSMGSVLMGPLADFFSYSIMYVICAFAAGAMVLFSSNRRGRSEPRLRN